MSKRKTDRVLRKVLREAKRTGAAPTETLEVIVEAYRKRRERRRDQVLDEDDEDYLDYLKRDEEPE